MPCRGACSQGLLQLQGGRWGERLRDPTFWQVYWSEFSAPGPNLTCTQEPRSCKHEIEVGEPLPLFSLAPHVPQTEDYAAPANQGRGPRRWQPILLHRPPPPAFVSTTTLRSLVHSLLKNAIQLMLLASAGAQAHAPWAGPCHSPMAGPSSPASSSSTGEAPSRAATPLAWPRKL